MTDPFYDDLRPVSAFEALVRSDVFVPVPADWVVGVADIADSSAAIEAGAYKTVNMIGAAVISAVRNALEGMAFPVVFGGDGASFAVPPGAAGRAEEALRAVQAWSRDAFGLRLRAAMLPVSDIRAAGHDVRVARHAVSAAVDYAMFSGGGLSWAEDELKAGRIGTAPAAEGTMPDLTGLSCRWSHLKARHGQIVSLLVLPGEAGDAAAFEALCAEVLEMTGALDRGGHPMPEDGPEVSWPSPGVELEASAKGRSRWAVLAETFFAWLVLTRGWRPGGFDAVGYRRDVVLNADFRKFDDGLKMTLDCDAATLTRLEERLERAAEAGVARYGLQVQDEAMMTCIVPSVMQADHLHFVDGAAGGYSRAAARLKGRGGVFGQR